MNADHDPPRVDFTLPESIPQHSVMHSVVPETPPPVSLFAQVKSFKDTCIVLQILHSSLLQQGMCASSSLLMCSDQPFHIPQEMVFNPNLSSHRD